jgi:hypothetical protein
MLTTSLAAQAPDGESRPAEGSKKALVRQRERKDTLCQDRIHESAIKSARALTSLGSSPKPKRELRKNSDRWARQDSNLEPRDYESHAPPLSYGPLSLDTVLRSSDLVELLRGCFGVILCQLDEDLYD